MHTPSFQEAHISQIPAIQLLQQLGFEYCRCRLAGPTRHGFLTLERRKG